MLNDGNGWVGEAIDTAFRILDAQVAKAVFAESDRMIAVVSSKKFFDEVIAPDPSLAPELYAPIPVSVKTFTGRAYVRLHGDFATATSAPPALAASTEDDQSTSVVGGTALDMIPREDLTTLRFHLAPLNVPRLPITISRALGPATPLPSLTGVTDAWSAFQLLSDFNAGPDGIPPAITFLRLLAEQLEGELGAVIIGWVREQARQLRLGPVPAQQSSASSVPIFHLVFHRDDLDELLALEGPGLPSLFEASPSDAPPLGSPGHGSQGFPIWIYLSTAAGHELVQSAVEDLVSTGGAVVIERADPEIGSWMRRLIGRMKIAAETPVGQDAATTVAHAMEARLVQAQDATNTATLMQNLAPLLAALQHSPSAVVRVGALLIVKNGDILAVHQLTAAQQFHLNHKPDLLASPHDILHALGLHTTENTAPIDAMPNTPPGSHRVIPACTDSEPVNGVGPAWQRITVWLRTNAPATAATLRPPAPTTDIRAAQHAIGQVLPDDLLAWWRLTDGVDDERDHRTAFTLPGVYIPLPVTRVRETWLSLSAHPDANCCHTEGHHLRLAGEPTARFCTALIPICRTLDGAILAVDLRPGTKRGHVMDWTDRTGAHPTTWRSVSALLTDTAGRLEDHNPARTNPAQPGRPMIGDDGALSWA